MIIPIMPGDCRMEHGWRGVNGFELRILFNRKAHNDRRYYHGPRSTVGSQQTSTAANTSLRLSPLKNNGFTWLSMLTGIKFEIGIESSIFLI